MDTIEGIPVDVSPLKNALVDYFALLLKYLGGAAMAHRLISPESAHGLLSYAEPLASIALVWAGHTITQLKFDGLRKEIQFLKVTFNHATALANSKLAQSFAEKTLTENTNENSIDPSSVRVSGVPDRRASSS